MSDSSPVEYYYSIEKESNAEFKDRGSSFLACAFPISSKEEFKNRLKQIKGVHSKASHHCFAYRLGLDGNNPDSYRDRSSDDGEPSGSAGRPILGQIDSNNLTNIAIVVTRYFGGTLLGIPGLINAYKTAASFALQQNPFVKKPVLVNYRLQFDYTIMNEVMRVLKKYDCVISKNEMQLFCILESGIPKANLELVLIQFNNLKGLELTTI